VTSYVNFSEKKGVEVVSRKGKEGGKGSKGGKIKKEPTAIKKNKRKKEKKKKNHRGTKQKISVLPLSGIKREEEGIKSLAVMGLSPGEGEARAKGLPY